MIFKNAYLNAVSRRGRRIFSGKLKNYKTIVSRSKVDRIQDK
jgi:hypothetical protein